MGILHGVFLLRQGHTVILDLVPVARAELLFDLCLKHSPLKGIPRLSVDGILKADCCLVSSDRIIVIGSICSARFGAAVLQ